MYDSNLKQASELRTVKNILILQDIPSSWKEIYFTELSQYGVNTRRTHSIPWMEQAAKEIIKAAREGFPKGSFENPYIIFAYDMGNNFIEEEKQKVENCMNELAKKGFPSIKLAFVIHEDFSGYLRVDDRFGKRFLQGNKPEGDITENDKNSLIRYMVAIADRIVEIARYSQNRVNVNVQNRYLLYLAAVLREGYVKEIDELKKRNNLSFDYSDVVGNIAINYFQHIYMEYLSGDKIKTYDSFSHTILKSMLMFDQLIFHSEKQAKNFVNTVLDIYPERCKYLTTFLEDKQDEVIKIVYDRRELEVTSSFVGCDFDYWYQLAQDEEVHDLMIKLLERISDVLGNIDGDLSNVLYISSEARADPFKQLELAIGSFGDALATVKLEGWHGYQIYSGLLPIVFILNVFVSNPSEKLPTNPRYRYLTKVKTEAEQVNRYQVQLSYEPVQISDQKLNKKELTAVYLASNIYTNTSSPEGCGIMAFERAIVAHAVQTVPNLRNKLLEKIENSGLKVNREKFGFPSFIYPENAGLVESKFLKRASFSREPGFTIFSNSKDGQSMLEAFIIIMLQSSESLNDYWEKIDFEKLKNANSRWLRRNFSLLRRVIKNR